MVCIKCGRNYDQELSFCPFCLEEQLRILNFKNKKMEILVISLQNNPDFTSVEMIIKPLKEDNEKNRGRYLDKE